MDSWITNPFDSDQDCIYLKAICKEYPFWNKTGVSPTSDLPVVTICFQSTVITWVSCGILWLAFPFYAYSLTNRSNVYVERMKRRKRSWLNIVKLAIGLLQIVLPLLEAIVVLGMASKKDYFIQFLMSALIRMVTMCLACCLAYLEFSRAVYTSAVLTVHWFLYAVINAFSVYAVALRKYTGGPMDAAEKAFLAMLLVEYCICLVQLLGSCLLVDDSIVRCIETTREAAAGSSINQSRINYLDSTNDLSDRVPLVESSAKNGVNVHPTFASSLFFAWVMPLLYRGLRREHRSENLPEVPESDLCSSLFPTFDEKLRKDLENNQYPGAKKSKIYSRRLMITMLGPVIFWGFVRIITVVLLIVNLLFFRKLIGYVKDAEQVRHRWYGYLLAVGLLLVALVRAVCVAHWLDGCDRIGLRLKIIISTTVYRKILKLSSSCAAQGMDIGYISNLMSVDSLKLFQSVRSLHEVVTMPIYLVLALAFMEACLGVAGVVGIVCLIVVVPSVTFGLTRLNRTLQERQMMFKDKRLKFVGEILAGMKVLKLYAWEDPFEEKVRRTRDSEMRAISAGALINAVSNTVCLISPFVVSLIIFAYRIYVEKKELDPSDAFVCLSLVCMLNCSISVMPCSLSFLIQGIISVKKAATLMDMDEVEGDLNRIFTETGPAVSIDNASFSWDGSRECLSDIALSVKPGKLVAVVGLVGSGKSSLLASILGEMKTVKGNVKVREKTVYVSQQAWIQNCTIRENICLNQPFLENKYKKVVEACHLTKDFENLKKCDLTVVGGKGANLSGGQRQRVNLARAVYTKADVYLIDDSLSAVDPKVARHIFKEVIGRGGVLRNKTRIFATNSIGFLPEVDTIVVMNNGKIEAQGSYEEIIRVEGKYFDFLRSHAGSPEMSISTVECKNLSRGISLGPGSIFPCQRERDINNIKKQMSNYELEYRINRSSRQTSMVLDDVDMSGDYVTEDVSSVTLASPLPEAPKKELGPKMKWSAIRHYIKSGGYLTFFVVTLAHLVMLLSQSATYVWLQIWMDNVHNSTNEYYITRYSVIGIVEICSIAIICLSMSFGFSSASRVLHERAVRRLFRAPMSYFELTSMGQIFNYLSTDMDTVDCALPLDTQLWLISFCVVISSVGTIACADYSYLGVTLPILLISAVVQRIYGKSAIQLRREYAVKKTPVYSHFEESISGIVSIRSYRKEQLFISRSDQLTDESHKPWHSYLVCWRWYTLFNELMGVLAIFLTAVAAIELQSNKLAPGERIMPGKIGLALFAIFQVLPHIPIATRMMIEVEAHIVAVERLIQCASIAQEASREADPGFKPNVDWPSSGSIQFQNMSAKYQPHLEDALKDINLSIGPSQKIGVVGQTGAGKSSLISTLFRTMEASKGSIIIDEVNIGHIGLHDLRSKLTCVPQEPILFSGSLRDNLDALSKYPDDTIWNALEQTQLTEYLTENMPTGLDHVINSEDEVCVGQRQLICLARALLRNSTIIILDEPTAAVDYQTDQTIQTIIRKEFSNSTVLTVAHRLSTVMDCDRILVLERGKVLEFDSPENLLANPNSKFAEMDRIDKKEN